MARTLDIIGERWTILLLRDLFLQGPRRFQDFQRSLAGVAPNTLSARLKTMEAQGLIARRLYSEHPPRLEYHLTAKGRSLGPVLKALRDWGERQGGRGPARGPGPRGRHFGNADRRDDRDGAE